MSDTAYTGRSGTDHLREDVLAADPLACLSGWVDSAAAAGNTEPNAMVLATSGSDNKPTARTVVVTSFGADFVRFHSSRPTTKTDDLDANPQASGVFRWPQTGRQVVLHGPVTELDVASSDEAFATRPRVLQLIAWVYDHATAAPTRRSLLGDFVDLQRHYADTEIERPASWTTYELTPSSLFFWQAGSPEATDGVPNERVAVERHRNGWQARRVLP